MKDKIKSQEKKEKLNKLEIDNLLNADYQRLARGEKKAFLSKQCKVIKANNRIWKARDIFKKIIYTKGIFHAKTGTIKDRKGMDLKEVEDINKRW